MKKISLLAISLLFTGSALFAQVTPAALPCSTFENPAPQGNWVTQFCGVSWGNINSLDGSQCATLNDWSGPSWFVNQVDFNSLGQKYLHHCLCFDYFLVDDGDPTTSLAVNPTIYLNDGVNGVAFVANVTVYEGVTGWVHVCAPIELCSGSGTLPSNADGNWTMGATMSCADFNNVMMNVTSVGFPTDFTSYQTEEMRIDNVCIKQCSTPCNSHFSLQTNINTLTGQVDATLFLLVTDPGATYVVDWGDGSPTTSPYVSHLYPGPGNYIVCVSEYDQRGRLLCRTCVPFCFGKPKHEDYSQGGGSDGGVKGRSASPSLATTRFIGDKQFSDEQFAIFPNPAKDYVEVKLRLAAKDQVSIRIIDTFGKTVSETSSRTYEPGSQNLKLNTDKLPTGVYTVEITIGNKVSTQKLSVMK